MLVEDDPNDVLLIQRALRKARLVNPIEVVSDGEEAVNYLAGHGPFADRERYPLPVLILLDLKLPRKSGFEVLEWLRQQPKLKRVPVVVLTSSSRDSDINHAYDLGANSYLVKPPSFDALLKLVEEVKIYWLMLNVPPQLWVE